MGLSLLSVFLPLTALHAQLTKIFVASTGNDANDGSRGSPKRTFQAAHDAVAAKGQIVALDTAGYGSLNITKSVGVIVPPGVNGFITVTTNGGKAINIAAAVTDVITLRGLILEGPGESVVSDGVQANNSFAKITIEDCTVRNFFRGIFFNQPASNVKLFVYNTTVRDCKFGIFPEVNGAGNVATAVIDGCRVQGCTDTGIGAQRFNNGACDVSVSNCVISDNKTGVGIFNPNSVIRLNNCNITGNLTGVSTNGDANIIASRGNNTLENNASGNTFPNAYSAK